MLMPPVFPSMSSMQPPLSSLPPPLTAAKNPRYPSKTCKYAGVTFRSSRDKYQARIYKGNKEYNLGLYDIAADAALAYDVAHRLVRKVASSYGREKEALVAHEAEGDADHWIDGTAEEAEAANEGLDPDKLNFLAPDAYKSDRNRELDDSRQAGKRKHESCPDLDEVRRMVRKESIRVCKIIVGASNGGSNNYRRKGRKKKRYTGEPGAASKDGSLDGPAKKRKTSPVPATKATKNGALRTQGQAIVTSAWFPKDDAYYQAARMNPELIRYMGTGTLQAMLQDLPQSSDRATEELTGRTANDVTGSDTTSEVARDPSRADETEASDAGHTGPFAREAPAAGSFHDLNTADYTSLMGNSSYFGSTAGNIPAEYAAAKSPDIYHEYINSMNSMRDMYPTGMGSGGTVAVGQSNAFDSSVAEDYRRMMLARTMGPTAGMQGMTQRDDPISQANTDRFRCDNPMSMMSSGMDRLIPNDINSYNALSREQRCHEIGAYGNEGFSQQLRDSLQGTHGRNVSTFGQGGALSISDSQFFQTPGQPNDYSASVPVNGTTLDAFSAGGYNQAYNDMAQMLGMPGSSQLVARAQGYDNDAPGL